MADVIRINTLMRNNIDNYRNAVLLFCEERIKDQWSDTELYQSIFEEVSNMSDTDLICKALNDQFCFYKYTKNVKGL